MSGSRYVSSTSLLCCSPDACANIDSCTETIPEKACCLKETFFSDHNDVHAVEHLVAQQLVSLA